MSCSLCPNACGADRVSSAGACGVKNSLRIAKFAPHLYEEPPICGAKGSGAVFFCGCSLKCVFCQNYAVSRNLTGKDITVGELADIFRRLEETGVSSLDLVNPTHYAPQIFAALDIYRPKIPVVWNSHGYETLETLRAADPYVDIYLPDLKYFSPAVAERYTGKSDYFAFAAKAIDLMAQKPYVTRGDGMLASGTIVRHLVLPQNVADTCDLLDFFADYKEHAALSLMAQYTPFGDIAAFPELLRRLTPREYRKAVDHALSLGIENLFVQDIVSADEKFIPVWDF